MRLFISPFAGLVLVVSGGCLFPSLSDFERCPTGNCSEGGAAPTTPSASSGTPSTVNGSTAANGSQSGVPSASQSTGGGGSPGCPTSTTTGGGTSCALTGEMHGASGVLNPGQFVDGRCIDDREVTWLEYATFLDGLASDFASPCELAPVCGWKRGKADYTPDPDLWNDYVTSNPQGRYDDYAVTGIDWCDAATFCHWAGKELCGDRGGAPVDTSVAQWETSTEWSKACLATADFADCNTQHTGVTHPFRNDQCTRPADMTCGGTTGIRDLAGNVREWENTCEASGAPRDDRCYARGDWCFYEGTPCTLVQTGTSMETRDEKAYYIGFRCCWDAK